MMGTLVSLSFCARCALQDLHGLHVCEALSLLRRRLAALRAQRGAGACVHVLVGTGHHTHGAHARARLPAAVAALLRDELRLRVRAPTPGMLEVTL
jgi:DNA-nicking Smr family endonuclease